MSTEATKFEDEDLIPQCIEVMRSEGKISVSLLQRRLTLGYTRAAQLMQELESRAYVGPDTGRGLRDILIELGGKPGGDRSPEGEGCDRSQHSKAEESTPAVAHGTHNDRAISMTRSARRAACVEAGSHWERARAAKQSIDDNKIVLVNELRETGRSINVACGREQLLFNVDGNIFCREQLLPHLPASMSMEAVQGCVHIANKMEQPVTTMGELLALEKRLQPEFELIGLLPSPRAREKQQAHTKDFFNHFVSVFTSAKSTLADLEKPEDEGGLGPMSGWSRTVLEEFLENTQPVKEQILRAEKLALGRD